MASERVPAAALEQILREGLRPRPTLWSRLAELWTAVGPANLILGTATRVLAALSVAAGLVVLIATSGHSLGLLFALSPLLFLTLMGFRRGSRAVRAARRAASHPAVLRPQLAAFRFLLFGGAGVALGALLPLALAPAGTGFALTLSSPPAMRSGIAEKRAESRQGWTPASQPTNSVRAARALTSQKRPWET